MQILKEGGYNVLSLSEGIRRLYENDLPPRSVCLTFDDGFADFASSAYPILRQFGYPATVYLTTYYCHLQLPVFDVMCSYVLWKGRHSGRNIADICGAKEYWDIQSSTARKNTTRKIQDYARAQGLSGRGKDDLVAAIAGRLGVDYPALVSQRILQIMSPEEADAMAREGVDIQLHTHRHQTPLDRDLFRKEIEDNARAIAGITRSAPTHFCYPNGFFRSEFVPWLRELNVRSATTSLPGLASRHSEPLLLRRVVDTSSLTDLEFEAWVAGAASLLPLRSVFTRRRPEIYGTAPASPAPEYAATTAGNETQG
jgi:peptidoglycan/xylan/chitin deacetylase (PgdA/CDA1 family)